MTGLGLTLRLRRTCLTLNVPFIIVSVEFAEEINPETTCAERDVMVVMFTRKPYNRTLLSIKINLYLNNRVSRIVTRLYQMNDKHDEHGPIKVNPRYTVDIIACAASLVPQIRDDVPISSYGKCQF